MGLVFASYNQTKSLLTNHPHVSPSQSDFIAGAVSGFVSKFCLMPVDVIRKRFQVSRLQTMLQNEMIAGTRSKVLGITRM